MLEQQEMEVCEKRSKGNKRKKRQGKEILFSSLGFPFKFQGFSRLSLLSHSRVLLIPFHYFFVSKYQGSGKRYQGKPVAGQREDVAFSTQKGKENSPMAFSTVE